MTGNAQVDLMSSFIIAYDISSLNSNIFENSIVTKAGKMLLFLSIHPFMLLVLKFALEIVFANTTNVKVNPNTSKTLLVNQITESSGLGWLNCQLILVGNEIVSLWEARISRCNDIRETGTL